MGLRKSLLGLGDKAKRKRAGFCVKHLASAAGWRAGVTDGDWEENLPLTRSGRSAISYFSAFFFRVRLKRARRFSAGTTPSAAPASGETY